MSHVDVIVPCHNYGDMLEACVRSVLAQEHVAVRVLIMDDASTDSTETVGRRLAAIDRRVEYRRQSINRGRCSCGRWIHAATSAGETPWAKATLRLRRGRGNAATNRRPRQFPDWPYRIDCRAAHRAHR